MNSPMRRVAAVTISVVDDKFTRATNNISAPPLFQTRTTATPSLTSTGGISNQTFPTTGFNGSPFTQTFSLDNFIDNLTKVWGKHTVKTGFYRQRSHNKRTSVRPHSGQHQLRQRQQQSAQHRAPVRQRAARRLQHIRAGQRPTHERLRLQQRRRLYSGHLEGHSAFDSRLRPAALLLSAAYDIERQLGLFDSALCDRSKRRESTTPVCLNAATCASGANRRAVDPRNWFPSTPTTANTLPTLWD